MFLTPEQIAAIQFVKNNGFIPSLAITLNTRSRKFGGASVVSLTAIKDGERYNVKVSVEHFNNFVCRFVAVDMLRTVIDEEESTNIFTPDGCVISRVERKHVKLT